MSAGAQVAQHAANSAEVAAVVAIRVAREQQARVVPEPREGSTAHRRPALCQLHAAHVPLRGNITCVTFTSPSQCLHPLMVL
eukprot:343856-Pyramimonas_sp.AAC.1